MKKSIWLLCLFLTAFSLISCGKLFEPAEDPEKKYLSVTTMTPNDALAYIGDITDSFPSPNDHYIVRNCFGYSELYAKTVIVEYSGLSQAYSTYFSNLETNTRMQFDYVNPVYNSSREYVEFIIYFEPEKKTDGYPSEAVAYELRYLCGDFTNPPATGNYAKKVILSPDMQVDILTETFITTGEKIHYWGSPSAGPLKIQSAPILTGAMPVSHGNDDNGGAFGNTRKLKESDYPDVWAQMGALGTISGIYANFDSDGNIVPTSYYGATAESFLVEYRSLNDAVLTYKNNHRLVYNTVGSYSYSFDSDCYYAEYNELTGLDILAVYLLDIDELQAGNECGVRVWESDAFTADSSFIDYIQNGGIKQIEQSYVSSEAWWSQLTDLGTISQLYGKFDASGSMDSTVYYAVYFTLEDDVVNYYNAHVSGDPDTVLVELDIPLSDGLYYVIFHPVSFQTNIYSASDFLNGASCEVIITPSTGEGVLEYIQNQP